MKTQRQINYMAIPGMVEGTPIYCTPYRIVETLSNLWGMEQYQLFSKDRQRPIVVRRQILAKIIYDNFNITLAEIGQILGGLDHATILHSVRTMTSLIEIGDEQATIIYNDANLKVKQRLYDNKRFYSNKMKIDVNNFKK